MWRITTAYLLFACWDQIQASFQRDQAPKETHLEICQKMAVSGHVATVLHTFLRYHSSKIQGQNLLVSLEADMIWKEDSLET